MSVIVQHRRGSRAEAEAATPAAGELWFDNTLKALRAGDGVQAGGYLAQKWARAYTVSPAQITANQNDYNPTDLAIAEVLFLNSDAARDLTGIQNGVTDRILSLVNTGSFAITLKDASTSSSAANRFSFGADFQLRPKYAVTLIYSAASSRWFMLTDAFAWKTIADIPENLTLSGDLSPAQITANQNDYNPAGLATASVLRLSTDASRNLTGLAGGVDGRIVVISNVGSFAIVLTNADANSSAANRFDFGANITLAAKNVAVVQYDATESRWKLIASTAGAAVADGAVTAPKLANSSLGFGVPMVNGTLAAAVAGNALTISIKNLAGNDPSPTDPVYVLFRNVSLASGLFTVITLTAAVSLTISSGSSLGSVNATAFKLWVTGFNDGGTFRLAAINCWTGSDIVMLDEWNLQSTTSEGGAGGADSAGVFYTPSGIALASKAMRILGFMEWGTGLAAAGTWSAGPTQIALMAPGLKLPGDIVQIRSSSTTVGVANSTTSYADTNLTETITPRNASNVISINAGGAIASTTTGTAAIAAMHRGGTLVGGSVAIFSTSGGTTIGAVQLSLIDAPAVASALTYTLRIKSQTGGNSVSFPEGSFGSIGTLQLAELMT